MGNIIATICQNDSTLFHLPVSTRGGNWCKRERDKRTTGADKNGTHTKTVDL